MYIIKVVSGGKRRSGSTLGKQDWGVSGSFLLSIYPLGFFEIQIFLFSSYNILLSPLFSCTLQSLCGRRPHRLGEIETSQCLGSDFSIPTAEYGNLMFTCRSQSVFATHKFDGLELCKSIKLLPKLHAGYILMDLSLLNQAYTFPSLGFGSCYIDPRILISISRLVFPS